MKRISVMLIDDHTLMRDAIASSLSMDPNFCIVASTGDVLAAIELAEKKKPDIILLEINMPEINGFELIVDIRSHAPQSRVIGMSAHTAPVYAKKIMELGASGYVTKSSSLEEMTMAIQHVNKGGCFICTEVKRLVAQQISAW